jgi:lysine 6-dehydrogenase
MAGKSYIVLGTGLQGVAAAFELALNGNAGRITLADAAVPVARAASQRIKRLLHARGAPPPRISVIRVDGRRESDLFKQIRGHDGVLNALPYYLNVAVARAAIAARAHYVDLGGHFETTQEILRLDRPAQKMGLALTPDCGLAPGLCNSLAAHGILRLERVSEVKIFCGGLPEHPVQPLGYKKVFNLEGLLDTYFGTAYVLKNGQVTQTPGFSEKEEILFDAPVGNLEAFVTVGATSTAPWTHEGRVRSYSYKTLRYPGHFDNISTLKQLGLLDDKPISIDGHSVVPKRLLMALAHTALAHPEVRDLVVLRVIVRGERVGQPTEIIYDLLEYEDPHTGFSATQRLSGFSAAIALEMLVTGTVRVHGVAPIERAFSPMAFLDAVQRRGLRIQETGPRPIPSSP